MQEQPRILLVAGEPATLELVKDILSSGPYAVDTASSAKEGLARMQAQAYDLVLTDMMMPDMGGMELVKYFQQHHPATMVIVFTGFAHYQDAVAAIKLGAFDYLTKPLEPEILRHAVHRALQYQNLSRSQRDLEVVFQGAEALGWQALETVLSSSVAAALKSLRDEVWGEEDLRKVGRGILETARALMQVTHSSIFLFDATKGQFSGLAALGPQAEARAGAMIPALEGVMGYVANLRRPLLVPDLSLDPRFSPSPRPSAYHTTSFMAIPLTGYKFWGVVNLSDREDGQPFSPQDLFLGWLLGRLLVEILETRQPPEEQPSPPTLASWMHEELPLGLALVDQDLKVIQPNSTLAQITGIAEKRLVGHAIFPHLGLTLGDQHNLEEAFREVLASQKPREFSCLKTTSPEKSTRFLAIKMNPWHPDRDEPRGLLLVEDVSELEQLKQRLQLYEHLAIMGKLTLCVAHELNNPLDGIRRYLSLAQTKKESPQEVERYLTEALKGLQKMSLSIKSLLFTANPYKGPSQSTDNLYNLLQDAIRIMMFQATDQNVQVSFHGPARFKKKVVETDLYYVFINIIKNALQAMPRGGHLKVDGQFEQHQVVITFEDTGPGLSPEELDLIFQPFYTTKEGAQGLGLGLPICQKIMERHQGRLVVESTKGRGTKVGLILPRQKPEGQNAR